MYEWVQDYKWVQDLYDELCALLLSMREFHDR